MPFKSERQRKYLYAKHPSIAKRWSAEAKAKKQAPVQKSKPKKRGG